MTPWTISPAGAPVHEILQAGILEWVAIPFPRDLPDPGIESMSVLQEDSLPKSEQECRDLPEVRQQRWEFGKDEASRICGEKKKKMLHRTKACAEVSTGA